MTSWRYLPPVPKDVESILDKLELAVARSPRAKARWDALSADDLMPLVDWVCRPRSELVARRRIREAVGTLERAPLSDVGGVRTIDLLAPPGVQGPSIWDTLFR